MYRCSVCGLDDNWNKQPLTLEFDHIDGDHKNNVPANIRVLCPNCHSQTPTYKAKNKGNGREIRRELYNQRA
jgi:5-methylcytosine-specific restriction endonuclease McrA